jgi:hypothetical protein
MCIVSAVLLLFRTILTTMAVWLTFCRQQPLNGSMVTRFMHWCLVQLAIATMQLLLQIARAPA